MESRSRYLSMARRTRVATWRQKIIIFHFINYIFCSLHILWNDLFRMAVEEYWEVFSLAHQALLIYLFRSRYEKSKISDQIVTENLEQSFHSVSPIYFSISKKCFFVESVGTGCAGWYTFNISPDRFHLTIHHGERTVRLQRKIFYWVLFLIKLTYDVRETKELKRIVLEINCLCLGGKWWLLYHLLQIILYNNWHITTLVDRNTIFYKLLYKHFSEIEIMWWKYQERQRRRPKGECLEDFCLRSEPHNIKAINQIFINLLDSLTIKTVQWFCASFRNC